MKDKLLLAYLAGVLDSDGWITIHRAKTNPKYPKSEAFSEMVGVGQTSDAAVKLLAARFGGTVRVRKRKEQEHWKPIFYWNIECGLAANCAKTLLPFLVVKRRQAEIVLRIRAIKDIPRKKLLTVKTGIRSKCLDPKVVAERIALWNEVRSLNDNRASNRRRDRA